MVDIVNYTLIIVTCSCFGLIVRFQVAHIQYCRKLTTLVRRTIASKVIAIILADCECSKPKNKYFFSGLTSSELVNTRVANS